MYSPFSWIKSALRLTSYFIVAIVVGWLLDDILISVAIAAVLLLVINYGYLLRLNHWLWHSKKITPPNAKGIWGQIYDGIYYMQRRNRNKRKQLGILIRRFREGSEALPDAAVVVDSDGHIVWCNRLARIELGLNWPEDADRRIDNLIRHPEFVRFFNNTKDNDPIVIESPINVDKLLEYRIMPYGEKHSLLIARDVTQLNQLEQMRKDFVANVSHELRTPLTVMTGYLEMLREGADMPASIVDKAYDEMDVQSHRMQNLVEQLLTLSRIEGNTERVYEKVVNVPTLLKTIEAEAATLNKQKYHHITFEIDDSLAMYGLETELRSAFSNLIFNAIKYTPEGGDIQVSWLRTDSGARFSVVDNGEGIPQQHVSRLTERFYRVDKARSRKTGGTGLGLSIVKHVLSHHNSRLEINSEVGKGSQFAFSFNKQIIADIPNAEAV
ncbi:MAG: phosphate regulon sensor histidine kinase PhoR [Aestuariibacter sp.]